ncbi:hypothetical protein BJ165DRAFT_1527075 [Panaeolus papilionaceus]|nr:hypothetical protein BJ165DRAFT_1527075 [Panaeolus papilionaceus]
MAATASKAPYSGKTRKLVIAFDVGTTFSGISYAILDPGRVPEIRGVTQFPGQENVGGDCKIPTLLYYDNLGTLKAAGAEAKDEAIEERADEEGWFKAEWFKLHLRPKTSSTAHITGKIPALPPGKTSIVLFADFLRYLYKCARSYIEERHANGAEIWRSLQADSHFVLTHPNGWEGAQQSQMRHAAILAGLIKDDAAGHSRISFLSEGEASLHFCVRSDLTTESIKGGKGILIVDAGGGTIDISAYKYVPGEGYEETTVPQCHLQGSIMVTTRAEAYLKTYLKGSKFADDVKHIAQSFDKATKHVFRNIKDWQYIKFGSPSDRDESRNIRRGQLKLTGAEVSDFFKPSVDCIIQAITQQKNTASADIRSVFLVGGFAANTYLFNEVKDKFSSQGIDVSRPDPNRVNKAVADGAISFYLDNFVTSRMAKYHYGTRCRTLYKATDAAHRSRANTVSVDCVGRPQLPGYFDKILSKGTKVTEVEEFRCPYLNDSLNKESLAAVNTTIYCYRGGLRDVAWFDEDPNMFHSLCTVKADVTNLVKALKPITYEGSGDGSLQYYEVNYDIVITFGKTEFSAHVEWMEKGVKRSSPAKLIYDADAAIPSAAY